MRRSEAISLSAFTIVSALALYAAIRTLPVMPIREVSAEGLRTASVSRILQKRIGRYLPASDPGKLRKELSSLPYVRNCRISYSGGMLTASIEAENGLCIITDDESYFYDGVSAERIASEDTGALSGLYPVIDAGNDGLSDELMACLPYLMETQAFVSLISVIEYCNISETEPFRLSIGIPGLNAGIIVSDPDAMKRLPDSLATIKEESRRNPGSSIFSSPIVYELSAEGLSELRG